MRPPYHLTGMAGESRAFTSLRAALKCAREWLETPRLKIARIPGIAYPGMLMWELIGSEHMSTLTLTRDPFRVQLSSGEVWAHDLRTLKGAVSIRVGRPVRHVKTSDPDDLGVLVWDLPRTPDSAAHFGRARIYT